MPINFELLGTVAPATLREQRAAQAGPSLTRAEREAVGLVGASTAAEAFVQTGSAADATRASLAGQQFALNNLAKVVAENIRPLQQTGPEWLAEQDRRLEAAHERTREREQTTFGDMALAARKLYTADEAILRMVDRAQMDFPEDPDFDYMANRLEYERGLSQEDREWLRESRSEEELKWRLESINERLEAERTLGAHGTGWAFAAGLAGGTMDATGMIASLGIGKALSLAGISARAAWVAGNRGRAIAIGGAEGAAANVLIDATVDASGLHVTAADYAASALFGAAFGQLNLIGRDRPSPSLAPEHSPELGSPTFRDSGEELVPQVQEEVRLHRTNNESAVDSDGVPLLERRLKRNPQKQASHRETATSVLERLMMSSDRETSVLARRLYGLIGDDITVEWRAKHDPKTGGTFDPTTQAISLNPGVEPRVQLHEISHALTVDRMVYGDRNPNSTIGKLTAEIDEIHKIAVRAAKGKDLSHYPKYYLSNRYEFVAGLYSQNNEFKDFLRSIKVIEDNTSLLNKLVNKVRQMLGIPIREHNAFTKALGLADTLMEQPHRIDYVTVHPRSGKERRIRMDQTPKERPLPTVVQVMDAFNRRINTMLDDAKKGIQHKNDMANFEIYVRAQQEAGTNPTPAQVAKAADDVQRNEINDIVRSALSPVPDGQRVFQRWDPSMVDENGNLKPIEEGLRPKTVREEVGNRWGITERTVEDPAERTLMQEIAAWAESFLEEYPLDQQRLNTLFARVPWMATTGLRMARSANPVARAFAGATMEIATGAGRAIRTAAITKAMRERIYLRHLTEYNDIYRAWRKKQGVGAIKDTFYPEYRAQFEKAVYLHRENRRLGVPDDVDPHISAAADALDTGYTVMGRDQKDVGTIGSDRLPDSGIGYAPRTINKAKVISATPEEIDAVVTLIEKQLLESWKDFTDGAKFARDTAVRYIERARTEAHGGVSQPMDMRSPETASILRDILRKDGVPADDIDKLLGRFSRGGPSHTKKRLELDLTAETTTASGQPVRLIDWFETDNTALYQTYARRVSGDVALTMHGIPGEKGLELIGKTMEYGPKASVDDIDAFKQTVAEFYGRPHGEMNAKWLDNLRALTSASRLGGMAFTQMAEYANGIGALGVKATMNAITSMPRLMKEVYNDKAINPILSSIELVGGDIGRGHRVIFPYQQADDIRVFGRDSLTAVDRFIRGGANAVPHLSGWHAIHGAQVRGMAEQIVHKSMRFIRDGGEDVALDGMGINADLRARLRAELDNIAKFDHTGALVELDLTKAQDMEAVAAYVAGVNRGAAQIIQGSFVGESGKWAHNGLLRILTQFRTFSLLSMEKQWTRQRVDHGTAKAFGLLIGQLSWALPLHLARTHMNAAGREDREEYLDRMLAPEALIRATMNYASLSGALGDIMDSGAMLLGLESSGVRHGASVGLMDSIPAIGYVNQTARGLAGFAPFSEREGDPKQIARALPGGNIPYITPLLNAAFDD